MKINKKTKKIIVIIAGILFIILVPLIAFTVKKGSIEEVSAITLSKGDDNIITINGSVSSQEKKEIYVDAIKGTNYTINVNKGDYINSGDVIISYNSDAIDSKISATEDQIKSKKDQLSSSKKKLQDLKDSKNDNPIPGAIDSQKDALDEKVSMVESDIKTTESSLKELKNQKNELNVKSPISGTVTTVNSSVTATSPAIVIQSNEKIVKGEITEYELNKINNDTTVSLNFKATGEEFIPSKIINISNNPVAATMGAIPGAEGSKISNYEITFEVPGDVQEIVKEGFHCVLKLGEESKAMEISKEVVYKDVDEETKLVWVIENKKLVSKEIKVKENDGKLELVEGLNDGDKVVDNPSSKLKAGDEVTIK